MRFASLLSTGALALILMISGIQTASAAGGVLHIEQKSPIAEYGHWVVTMPGDATYRSSLKTKVLNNLEAGTYKIDVVSPAGSQTKITAMKGSQIVAQTVGNSLTLDVKLDETLRVTISYGYTGSIRVLSDPAGVPFTMKDSSGVVHTGTTPAMFTEMAPVWYRVDYAIEADCEVQRDQQRGLIAGSNLTFWADFTCGDRTVRTAGTTPEPLGTEPRPIAPHSGVTHEDMPAKRIVQTSNMGEVAPGGLVRFTIAVTNVTRSTLHNVMVTNEFDPNLVDIQLPLRNDGVIAGMNEMVWEVPTIYAGQTWTTTYFARAHENLVAGDRIVMNSHAYSDEADFNLYPQAWSSTTGVGIAYMPQTGDTLNLILVLSALIGVGLLTNFTNRRKKSVSRTA